MNIYKDKKVFITGHTGFKGSWLYKTLEMLGAEVQGYSLLPENPYDHFNVLKKKCFNCDILDSFLLRDSIEYFKPDIIFHLAAQPLVIPSYQNPAYTFNVNINGTIELLEIIRKYYQPKAVIVITTDKVYQTRNNLNRYRYLESDYLQGYDPYSTSKVCVEQLVNCYKNSYFNIDNYKKTHNTLFASARAGNVIGGGDYSDYRLIPDIVKTMVFNKKELLIRNPEMIRPWQFILDCLYGYLLLGKKLLQGDKFYGINSSWNFGPYEENEITVQELVNKIKVIWNKFSFIVGKKPQNKETKVLRLDSNKANTLLKWKPKYNIEQTIEKTIEWYKEYWENGNIITEKQIKEYFNI